MSQTAQELLRQLPAIDELLRDARGAALCARHGRELTTQVLREVVAAARERLLAQGTAAQATAQALLEAAATRLLALSTSSLRPVFNLTGTVLHTNLGRAPLPAVAIEAMAAAAGACNLEYELDEGRRGDRDAHVEERIRRLTGAEAATVVNNNAAAVLLLLNTLARAKEVLVSRGELVEIGGAFRVPDVMARASARLVEVGTTNRTHRADFEQAIGARTALVMKVHTSNYAIHGYTAAVPEAELAALAHAHGLPFAVDLGSGTLIDLARYGLPHEPTVAETLASGADLVSFSGDKLLGGPQAGIIAGKASLVKLLKRNPMKRALRVDKVTLAALDAVLGLYADPERARRELLALRLLTRPAAEIEALAKRVLPAVAAALGAAASVEIVGCASQIGSGALPVDLLESHALRLVPRAAGGQAPARLARAFRALPVPVIGRVADGALLLDLRCLEDEAGFVRQLERLRPR
ncbi:MAG TPA: L-seryl-tRNA(Sec) selenium transferase [Gammaproteobacteria bacterium]|nr:L-seryl-tRNA(Sec) selenium transferase [Gammaproteobacteria bacterium]